MKTPAEQFQDCSKVFAPLEFVKSRASRGYVSLVLSLLLLLLAAVGTQFRRTSSQAETLAVHTEKIQTVEKAVESLEKIQKDIEFIRKAVTKK